jgi:pimeloyl-ACP methyl ester carboxylesterase
MQTVRFRGDQGLTLVGDEWNRGVGSTTILMLHGGGQNRFSWKNTGQILADSGLHVLALDARGHGDSDRAPAGQYTVHTLAADIAAVLEQIGAPVVIVGASMGGLTGILAAFRAGPQLVSGLVLVDVVPRFESEGTARIRDFMTRHVHGFETLDQAADAIAAYLPHRRRPRNLEGLKKNLRHRQGRWHWHWDPAFVTSAGDDPFADIEEITKTEIFGLGNSFKFRLKPGHALSSYDILIYNNQHLNCSIEANEVVEAIKAARPGVNLHER